jgi:alpha-D-ribose 1-methylphosphonate 5-triphosphate synthase subunit PhnH
MNATYLVPDDLAPGFTQPVFASQAIFRAVLSAMSHPGTVLPLPATPSAPPELGGGLGALSLSFADLDTPIWLDSVTDTNEARDYLAFHCGAPPVITPALATFALIGNPLNMPTLDRFALGEPSYPDRSTTLFIRVHSLSSGTEVTLRGAGIREKTRLCVDGLPQCFWTEWMHNRALFPLGIDVIFTDDMTVAALPRTTRVDG